MKKNIFFCSCLLMAGFIAKAQNITTVVGTGGRGFGGDGAPAMACLLDMPDGTTTAGTGNMIVVNGGSLYIADQNNNRIRREDGSTGLISTFAGNGMGGGWAGDGGPATAAQLDHARFGVAGDPVDNIYIADGASNRIRKVDIFGIITTIAGLGTTGYSGDSGPATTAQLSDPEGIATHGIGNIYFIDNGNNVVRNVDASGIITTIAGNGTAGYSGDGGPATAASIYPSGITVDTVGNVYIAENNNNRVRKISTSGIITTIAGTGIGGWSGDNGPATAAQLYGPEGIVADYGGNIYIADEYNNRIRKIDPTGMISTVAGSTTGFSGDGGPATAAKLSNPQSLSVDGFNNVYINDGGNNRIREIVIGTSAVQSLPAIPQGISIYPNPATNQFVIHGDETFSQGVVELYDITGRFINSYPLGGNDIVIPVAGFAPGLYQCRIITEAQTIVKAVVIK